MTGKRLMIDTSKCQACKGCQAACQQWHNLEAEDTTFTGSYQNPPDMSGANLTVVKFTEIEADGKIKWLFFKDQCRHCENPACKDVCRLGAIVKQANGIVRVSAAKCNPDACTVGDPKVCQAACPYGVPKWKYVKNGSEVRTKMKKCDFCYNRFAFNFNHQASVPSWEKKSRKPSCELTCPPGAILSGAAEGIWTKAQGRVSDLISQGFSDANIYPPQGGYYGPTHVIWVLTEDPSVYGLPIY